MGTSPADDFSQPPDTMRERIGESRLKLWLLITGNRWAVTLVISLLSYILLLIFYLLGGSSIHKLVTTSAVTTVFSSVLIAITTAVSLVLTISQFVLSQEVEPLGTQHERMQTTINFRTDIEETANIGTSPSEPSQFLRLLVQLVANRAQRLNETVAEESPSDATSEITAYTNGIIEHSQQVSASLDGTEFGSFQMLLPVLNYNYSWKIAAARNLRYKHADSISETVDNAFEDLLEALRFFGPAREHFKTLYFQWEIANVSRAMLYTSVPAAMIAGFVMFSYQPTYSPGSVFAFSHAFLSVAALFVISFLPFAILFAYLLRMLAVAQRTLAIGPFIIRETEALEEIETSEKPE